MNKLNTFAFGMIDSVNTEHRTGFGLDGVGDRDFFNSSLFENAARDMAVAIADSDHVAAANDSALLPGDNRNAKEMADLINQNIIDGHNPIDFYRAIVSEVGVEALSAKTNLKFHDSLVGELESRRQEISGVSLDEEAANLIKHQRLFEAAARMIIVADELLLTLINMIRR